ncbi:MAG: type 4a pilus biogenesis protein PilO [Armatimonadota bacterium]|nr:type 4a pilus biogenesis protein PilO [Armatimonadota bacterium]MDR7428150.1 type 4a pilus biogenesis protein PilO [Armatimonadota bacterium]MDR7470970.1 type 4a pilus biogenesis protein PilO [Armatimonadota bacterium]MDR7473633.1 type 4a pilus biogenesis protein PilO [Armatimonadota bacterium]MDR7538846.1 type 4a pilus biogenesis protein PilO [Armatimonadota bacterium]
MRFSGRERLLLSVLVTIAIIAVFYFLAYTPLMARRAQLSATLQQRQARLAEMQQVAAQRQALEQEYAARQQRIAAIEAKLPPAREIPTLLRQMQAVATESEVTLTLLRPGPLEAPQAGQQAGAAPPAGQAAGQQAAGQQPAPPYRQFRLELGFEGSFDRVLAFLRRLENFPRFIAMTQFTLAVQELPTLRLAVTSNTFVLPEER